MIVSLNDIFNDNRVLETRLLFQPIGTKLLNSAILKVRVVHNSDNGSNAVSA